jgi:hypothetical protein
MAITIYAVVMVILLARLVRTRSRIDGPPFLPFILRCVVGAIGSAISGWTIATLIPAAQTLHTALLRGFTTGGVTVVVFFLLCHVLGVEEVRQFLEYAKKWWSGKQH